MSPCGRGDWVSASDIGTFAFCARAYALGKVQKVYPGKAGEARLWSGVAAHGRHGHWYGAQRLLRTLGRLILWGALVVALLWLAWGCTPSAGVSGKPAATAIAAAVFVAVLLLGASALLRRRTGLPGGGRVLASDIGPGRGTRLRDPEHCLSGRPDYLLEQRRRFRRVVVPVELKPSRRGSTLHESDEMQLVVYLLLVRAEFGARAAPVGYARYRDHTFRVRLTRERTRRCLALRDGVRETRRVRDADRSHRQPGRCAHCSFRDVCGQALA